MRKLLGWIAALALIVGAVYLGSPYYTVWRLSQAVKAGDAKGVAAAIDFPAVRANLKPQLAARLEAQLAAKRAKPHGLLDQLSMVLAPYFAGTAVDMTVTPEALTDMMRTGRAPAITKAAPPPADPDQPATARSPTDTHAVDLGYVGDDLDQFHASMASRAHPGRRVTLHLLRRGVFTWKVVSLDLPTVGSKPKS